MFHPNRLQYNLNYRWSQIHPRFQSKLKFYYPLRGDGCTSSTPNDRFKDVGPNHYPCQAIASSEGFTGGDALGYAVTQIGDPYVADILPVTGSQANPVTGAHTLMGWARPYSRSPAFPNMGGGGNPYKIVGKLASGTNVNASLFVASDGKIKSQFTVGGSYNGNTATSFTMPQASVWRHYAATYDGAKLKVFLDGALVASAAATGTPDDGGSAGGNVWYLGRDNVLGGSQGCQYRDIAVWDRALSPADISFAFHNRDLMIDSRFHLAYIGNVVTDSRPGEPGPGGPYIKTRHGGTSHGAMARSVAVPFTVNHDDFIIEANGTFDGFLFPWDAIWQGREVIVKNVGAGTITMKVYDGSNIDGNPTLSISAGDAVRFMGGVTQWIVI